MSKVTSHHLHADLCLGAVTDSVDGEGMTPDTPLYRQTCAACTRPAVTLHADGTPACSDHADVVRKAPDDPADDGD